MHDQTDSFTGWEMFVGQRFCTPIVKQWAALHNPEVLWFPTRSESSMTTMGYGHDRDPRLVI